MPVAPSSVAEKNSVWRSVRGHGDDSADGRPEAHVEHAVGLVEDEDADLLQRDDLAVDQVLEPARGGDEDVGTAGGLGLRAEADAAVDGGDPQAAGVGDVAQLVDDLGRQLAGRCEDEGGGASAPGSIRSTSGNAEGERLARAGR